MLDFYYQMLNVPKGASQKQLAEAFAAKTAAYLMIKNPTKQQKGHYALMKKGYEVLKNVTVKRIYGADGKLLRMQFYPNEEYYQSFYDEHNRKKEEHYEKMRNQEGKGVYFYLYKLMVLSFFLLSLLMLYAPIDIAFRFERVWVFFCFFPFYFFVYMMWFHGFDYRLLEFARPDVIRKRNEQRKLDMMN